MELNSAISRHLIYRAIYILTQLAAPGVRRGITPPGSTRRLSAGAPKGSSPNISRTPTADPGEFCGQTAGAEFPGYAGKQTARVNLIVCARSITAGWRSTEMDARHIEEISVDPASAAPTKCDIREWPSSARPSRGKLSR